MHVQTEGHLQSPRPEVLKLVSRNCQSEPLGLVVEAEQIRR